MSRSKLNRKLIAIIAEKVANGSPLSTAARTSGISYDSYVNWKKRGEADEKGIYRDFYDAITEAEARGLENLIGVVVDQATNGTTTTEEVTEYDGDGNILSRRVSTRQQAKDWRAAVQMMRLRHPEHFNHQYVTHEGGQTLKIIFDDGEGAAAPDPNDDDDAE